MAKMRIGAALSGTFAFLKANWVQMLMWVGGALVGVGVLGYLFLGSTFSAMAMAPNDPSLIMGAFGKIMLFALIAAVIFYGGSRSEEHTSELQSLMRISYAVLCLKKKKTRERADDPAN